jgi:polyhydroxyalkanoate synthesis regulator phasin
MAGRGSERIAELLEELIVELPGRLRGSGARLSDHATTALRSLVDELNLVTGDDLDELELRVAQLEHRLRLLEGVSDLPAPPGQGQ